MQQQQQKHSRSFSLVSQNQQDDFRVFKKQPRPENKENTTSQANVPFTKSVEDKLVQMSKQINNESLNDQYLLTSLEQSVHKKPNKQLQSQLNSISFNLQSTDQNPNNLFIYSQDDYQADDIASKVNQALSSKQRSEQKYASIVKKSSQYQSSGQQSNYQTTRPAVNNSDNAMFSVLLVELERRFEMLDEKIQRSDKISRQSNQSSKFTQELVTTIQDKIAQLVQRVSQLESKLQILEEYSIENRNSTSQRFIEFNKHIDQALKQFVNSSVSIQKKVDKLTLKHDQSDSSKQSNSSSGLSKEVEAIKQRLDVISQNLTSTHETLSDQIQDFTLMQKSFQQLSGIDIDGCLNEFSMEIEFLKQSQLETLQYLRTFQENITTPMFN